jgi:hypothetical protein
MLKENRTGHSLSALRPGANGGGAELFQLILQHPLLPRIHLEDSR